LHITFAINLYKCKKKGKNMQHTLAKSEREIERDREFLFDKNYLIVNKVYIN
jgi:hypothetical protein